MARTFIACAKTDCKWNEEGRCAKSDIFVDEAIACASYEPEVDPMAMMMSAGGGMGVDPREALVGQMMAGPLAAPPMGPAPEPTGPVGAPPPLRY